MIVMESSESKDNISIDKGSSPSQSRPLSGNGGRTRPASANFSGPSSSRPRSALASNPAIALQIIETESAIRSITKQIKLLQRDKIVKDILAKLQEEEEENETNQEYSRPTSSKRPNPDKSNNENTIDPILDLEDQRHKLMVKYESLAGQSYQTSPQSMIWDFCELFYNEFQHPTNKRCKEYIYKYYDPSASLNIVGFKSFNTRETIVDVLMKRYEGLTVEHKIKDVKADIDMMPGSILSGNVTVYIKINDDEPRKVLHMVQFVKTKELGPFDYVLKKEFFVIQDARPLYHFAEEPPPLSALQLEYIRVKEERLQVERERKLKEEMEAEGESYDDGDEEGSLGEGSRSVVSGSATGSKAGGASVSGNKEGENRSQASGSKAAGGGGGSVANSVSGNKLTSQSIKEQSADENDDLSVDSALKSKS